MFLFQDMVCGVFNTEYSFVNIELNTQKKKQPASHAWARVT